MALTSVFYDGVVTEADRARNRGGVPDYGVYGANDFRVVAHPSIPFAVLVKAGRAHGHGVTDTAVIDEVVQCSTISGVGAVRWDLIVVRRNWQPLGGGPSTLVAVKGGTTTDIPSGRKAGPGIEDDQPIAMVLWKTGLSAPSQIIDLRCWASNGGIEIVSEIAFEYLERPGACIHFEGLTWRYARGANSVWDWETDPDATQQNSGLMSAADKKKLDASPTTSYVTTAAASALSSARSYADSVTPRKMATGFVQISISAGQTYTSEEVKLPAGFAAAPRISLTITSNLGYPGTKLASPMAINRSASKFDAKLATSDGQPLGVSYQITIDWIAILI